MQQRQNFIFRVIPLGLRPEAKANKNTKKVRIKKQKNATVKIRTNAKVSIKYKYKVESIVYIQIYNISIAKKNKQI
jgi:hypothetical protein